ncbi:hypothetical protein PGH07_08630 [Sulfurovum sp. zt1-1]|uniref:Uncharacterized protein n=1 Tax=Sulfurovum zhangzhouensis TaxID=3019067 RepID=A0ABT7R0E2_9BACT|nr:hypothetical protein [Sulfurovum zhangzhouensis]
MIKQYHKHGDRRHKSSLKPLLYLLMELTLLCILCWIVFEVFESTIANVLIVLASIYFFIISSWKRYRIVSGRQKYYEE